MLLSGGLIKLVSELRRSKRTVGKRILDLNNRVSNTQKRAAPRKIAPNGINLSNLAPPVSSAITGAQATADGKNAIYYQASAPSNSSLTTGDLWFDSDNGYALSKWDGSAWQSFGLGNAAFSNIDAGKITAGILNSIQINAGTPSGSDYPFSVSTAGVLRAVSGVVGGFTLSTSTISANYSFASPGLTESGYVTIETDGTIESRYNYAGVMTSYYTIVRINDYGASGQGSVTVEGTASGGYSKYLYSSSGPFNISDVRIKNVIETDTDALSIVNNINVAKFTYTDDKYDTSKEHLGFLAQQLNEHVPDAVHEGGNSVDEPWLVSKEAVVPYLARAIQQLSSKIDDLTAQVAALEN